VAFHHAAPVDSGPGGLRAQGRGRRAEELTPGEFHWRLSLLHLQYRVHEAISEFKIS